MKKEQLNDDSSTTRHFVSNLLVGVGVAVAIVLMILVVRKRRKNMDDL